jgi:hypothetical protein
MADQNISTVTQNQVGFAPQVAPYAETLLGRAQALSDPNIPYQAYGGERFAQFTPLQKQSFAAAQQMQTAPELQGAANMAQTAGQQAMNLNYDPTNYQTGSFTDQNVMQQATTRRCAASGYCRTVTASVSRSFGCFWWQWQRPHACSSRR